MRDLFPVSSKRLAEIFKLGLMTFLALLLPVSQAEAADPLEFYYYWYEPKPLSGIDEAAGTIVSLEKFFMLFSGIYVDQIVVTREGLAIHGSKTTIQENSYYQPVYGGSWMGSTYVPYFGGSTVTTPVPVTTQQQAYIPFDKVEEVFLLHFPNIKNGWAVHFKIPGEGKSVTLRTSDEGLARQFANAAVALIERNNPKFAENADQIGARGTWNDAKAFKKAKYKGTGFYVQYVTKGGPAEQAGLRPGDIWISINGQPRTGKEFIGNQIGPSFEFNLTFSFDLEVWRNKKVVPLHFSARNTRLAHFLAANPMPLGLRFRDLAETDPLVPGRTSPLGVYVVGVYETTLANRMDIRTGDILFELNGSEIMNGQELQSSLQKGKPAKVRVLRDGAIVELLAPPGAPSARSAPQRLGIGVREVRLVGSDQAYVEVVSIEAGLAASLLDFRVGDKLVEVNNQPIRSTADFAVVVAAGPIETAKVERAGVVVELGKVTIF